MITSRFSSAGSCELRQPLDLSRSRPIFASGARWDHPPPRLTIDAVAGRLGMFAVPLGWTRIGRSRSCALLLDDRSVSRRHALLIRTRGDDSLKIIDDRSLTGVLVNDQRVRWAELNDGDRVAIGCFELTVSLAPATVSPLPA